MNKKWATDEPKFDEAKFDVVKIAGLVVVTAMLVSGLAAMYVDRYPNTHYWIEAQPAMWGACSLVMGVVMAIKLRKWLELVWGVVFMTICSVAILVGTVIGLGYCIWCYVKLEKNRVSKLVSDKTT